MPLFDSFLNNVAKCYYPANVLMTDEQFNNTPETKAYLELGKRWGCDEDIKKLNDVKNKFSFFFVGSTIKINQVPLRANYHIEIVKEASSKQSKTTAIYISFMIPYYLVVNLNYDKEEESKLFNSGLPFKTELDFDYNIPEDEDKFIQNVMSEFYSYNKFPTKFLDKEISDVYLENSKAEITYRRAFFTEHFRMSI